VKAVVVRCVRCDARIKFVGIRGRSAALDSQPHAAGTVQIDESGDDKPTGRSLAGEALAMASGKLYRVHKCPKNARGLL